MNVDETIRANTHLSAYASFREDETGIFDVGRWADLTVMDTDPFTLSETDPGKLLNGEIVLTIVDGEIIYEAQ